MQRRPRAREVSLAAANHNRAQVNSILIDKAKVGQAPCQLRSGNINLPGLLSLQRTNRRIRRPAMW